MIPPCPAKANCLFWAWALQLLYGGQTKFMWSHNGPWPHWIWIAPDGQKWSYEPVAPHKVPYDYVWFFGKVTQDY